MQSKEREGNRREKEIITDSTLLELKLDEVGWKWKRMEEGITGQDNTVRNFLMCVRSLVIHTALYFLIVSLSIVRLSSAYSFLSSLLHSPLIILRKSNIQSYHIIRMRGA